MPCQCEDYGDTRWDEADKATRAACDMRTILRQFKLESRLTLETRIWIAKHDREDAKRISEENAAGIRERVKQKAMDKLTLEERRVLGL
jgi:hypothetical protein